MWLFNRINKLKKELEWEMEKLNWKTVDMHKELEYMRESINETIKKINSLDDIVKKLFKFLEIELDSGPIIKKNSKAAGK